jgi:hypothetical protein
MCPKTHWTVIGGEIKPFCIGAPDFTGMGSSQHKVTLPPVPGPNGAYGGGSVQEVLLEGVRSQV